MRVPTYNSGTVAEAAAPVTQQSNAPAEAFGAPVAQGLANVAGAMQQMQADADNLRALDADNKAAEKLLDLTYGPEKGFFNVKGRDILSKTPEGKSRSEDYIEQARKAGADIEAELTNEAQKTKFRQRLDQRLLSLREGALRHEIKETTKYAETVTTAAVKLETESALKQWNDPVAIETSITNIKDSLRAQGMREGMGADVQTVIINDKVSKLHGGVLAMAVEAQNLSYANDYLKKYGKDMEAGDILKYKGMIDKEIEDKSGQNAGVQVVQKLTTEAMPTEFGRLMNLVRGRESGNRQTDEKGVPITSVKGATGIAQVMPETGKEVAKRMGVAWDETRFKKDAVYNNALGENELAFNLKTYGGDVAKSLAAYNAGRGAVAKAEKEAEKDGKPGAWLSYLPKETRDYVPAIMSKFGTGLGSGPRATEQDVIAALRSRKDLSPRAMDTAIKTAKIEFATQEKAIEQREKEATDHAFKMLNDNGGNYLALPASVRSAIPGDKIDSVQKYAVFRAKGVEANTQWNVYYELRKDQNLLKETNLLSYKHALSDTEFKELVTKQDDLRSGKTESLTATRGAGEVLNGFLREAGINPSPKPDKSENSEAARVGRAMRAQQVAITEAEIAKGKKLTPDEVEKVTAKLFTNVQVKGSWWNWNDTEKQRFDLRESDEIVVPAKERAEIIAAMKRNDKPVKEANILDTYLASKNIKR